MTNEEKSILLKDICSRVSNGGYVKVSVESTVGFGKDCVVVDIHNLSIFVETTDFNLENAKVYLRPMSSMTEEEFKEYSKLWDLQDEYATDADIRFKVDLFDWLNKKMFDYRDLIPMGIALPATEGMYNKMEE